MRVVQIMPEFNLAGAERMCQALSLELKNEIEVIVVSLYSINTEITELMENNGIKVIYLDKKPGLDLLTIKKLYMLFKEIKPDVIHTHRYVMQYAIPAAFLAGVKRMVHTVHSMADKEVPKLQQKLHYLFFKYFRVIPVSISPVVQQSIINRYKLESDKVPIIYNGIDLKTIYDKLDYERNEVFTFLHVGRFTVAKNHFEMIKAFQKLHEEHTDTRLLLVGVGELFNDVKEYIKQNNLSDSVIQLGLKNDVISLYKLADVFILPSVYEGMPMTIIEAMATGMPIIATNVGGIPDMLTNEKSALLSGTDSNEIYENMLKMYEDKLIRKKLGEQAKAESIKFSAINMAIRYKKLYFDGISDGYFQ